MNNRLYDNLKTYILRIALSHNFRQQRISEHVRSSGNAFHMFSRNAWFESQPLNEQY
jgi:hypothetical protein